MPARRFAEAPSSRLFDLPRATSFPLEALPGPMCFRIARELHMTVWQSRRGMPNLEWMRWRQIFLLEDELAAEQAREMSRKG